MSISTFLQASRHAFTRALQRRMSCALAACAGLAAPSACLAHGALIDLFTVGTDAFSCVVAGDAPGRTHVPMGGVLWVNGLHEAMVSSDLWPAAEHGVSPLFQGLTLTCWNAASPLSPMPTVRYVLRLPRESPVWIARDDATGAVHARWPQAATETMFIIRRVAQPGDGFTLTKAGGTDASGHPAPPVTYTYGGGMAINIPFERAGGAG